MAGRAIVGEEEDRVILYRINDDGFRDRDYPRERRPGTFRILVLGDSVAYGTGVQLQETLAKQMEARFRDLVGEGVFEGHRVGAPSRVALFFSSQ